jgi:hypothetical protein
MGLWAVVWDASLLYELPFTRNEGNGTSYCTWYEVDIKQIHMSPEFAGVVAVCMTPAKCSVHSYIHGARKLGVFDYPD